MSKWISVNERLPKHKQEVVWWCKFHDTNFIPVVGWIKYYSKYEYLIVTPTNQTEYKRGEEERIVTHWIPLPKPPKE